jgi:hypothetical protein
VEWMRGELCCFKFRGMFDLPRCATSHSQVVVRLRVPAVHNRRFVLCLPLHQSAPPYLDLSHAVYLTHSPQIEEEEYQLKPMNCPFHVGIYKQGYYSYRDLPVRMAELGTVYR